ncbi:MAG TPA: SDR family NAD(P)-dependent oxidoreductase [Polyangia bacterium]|nr:SDR family NAD(P)-dependent oxidoreductase [Polyangia bacterium]
MPSEHTPLDGKTALVTGGSRGIGLSIARHFAAAGARLAICGRDDRALAAAAAIITSAHPGASVLWVPCDVARFEQVRHLHATVDAQLGVPDVIVNNAGVVVRQRLDEMSEASWDQVVDANLKGTFNVTRVFLPQMRTRGSGRIVNIASISGRQGTARLTAYCAAKHGVVGLTRALAEETRGVGIQVNAVCPGSVDTDMLKGSGYAPQMSPDEVANVALYVAAYAPAALTGACIDVFG